MEKREEILNTMERILKGKIDQEKTFLDSGGDSITAMEVIWELDTKGYRLDLNMLFNQNVGEILDHVVQG
ncbi:acyl carrier protein [Listeria monocytogenes]|uniref:acyl carrier protein n=1 Tax=Listeria monocytogenes TaxID=1639 RepID=UPI0010E13DC9|nr:acyl carrier protein [Listeria monocytogenes]EAD7632596.1 acyl carrier protein [Listeria monocytogenes]